MGGGQSKLLATLDGFDYLETLKVSKSSNENKKGFTLAEVLVTLGIVGVVAAMTFPMLKANIDERVNTERQVNIVQKITKAMEVMKSQGELYNFNSTDEFVDSLQRYIKVVKRCDSEHIEECWPTKTVKNGAGLVYEVKDAQRRNNLGIADGQNVNNVGLVLADGAYIIMTYNPLTQNPSQFEVSKSISKPLPIGNGKTKDFIYTTDVTSGIAFVMDVNGKEAPNQETLDGKSYDIRSFNGAHFGTIGEVKCGSGIIAGDYCVEFVDSYTPIPCNSSTFADYCGINPSGLLKDYWAGANYACAKLNKHLPSYDEFIKLQLASWDGKPTSGDYWTSYAHPHENSRGKAYAFNFNTLGYAGLTKENQKNVLCIGDYK